jgi:protein-tyrosine phosphatase
MLIVQGANSVPIPVRIDWMVNDSGPLISTAGRLALSSCPGRPDLGGSVERDVQHLVTAGIGAVVTLVSDSEMERYGVVGLRRSLRGAKLINLHFPFEDALPPTDLSATQSLCRRMLELLEGGTHVLVHCIGGWGRSGTIAASLLTERGYEPEPAIAAVRRARSPRCVESYAQERFVHDYARARGKSG